ncbi:MAG: aminotransferase class I/II-fold pyridoxal phosphate-dependent enzyme [Deltaproteobacteria bacterium]|nr:aminotransferase class I/II-fold pyridoxal phosphate-dependent enzyme [Deltaproteobacteria bacterium]MBW2007819.1 aminotransferase class I/II-fold pyridoxal phosphate-dependent enzyme [Deltaproteobacteria bacterium]
MNPLATELNTILQESNVHLYEMLSRAGKELFFPKGILSQSAEAKEKAYRFNATIGMATEKGRTMYLPSIMNLIGGLEPEEALTYAPSFGIKPLREAWRESLFEKNPSLADKRISLPVVSHAITHGLSVLSDVWVDPGDVIVLPDKMWGNYNLIFGVRRGALIRRYPLFDTAGGFNLEAFAACVREAAAQRDKVVVILNFPNNPTGYTVNEEEARKICKVLKETAEEGKNVLVFTDDAYFGLFYDDACLKESIFARLAGIHPRLLPVKLDGATKEDFVWGLRVGFITYGPALEKEHEAVFDALERKTAGAVRGSISNASHLSQEILLKAMGSAGYRDEKAEKFRIMRARAETVRKVLENPRFQEAWEVYPFNSGYFMCLRLKTVPAEDLRVHLLEKYGVGLIALGQSDLRIAFSCVEESDIPELFDTILKGVLELNRG